MKPALKDYLERKPRGEMARIAREAGVDYTTVWKLANQAGYRLDSYSKAKAVEAATGGEVTVAELCEASPPHSACPL